MGKKAFETKSRDDSSNIYTVSGISVKNIYRPNDLKDFTYEKNLADPGVYPYTRGVYPDMYRKQF